MRWTQTQADCLMQLAEKGTLTPQQLQTVTNQAPLQPAPTDWLHMAKQVLAMGGALLLAAGVIYFFAYNWADLPRFAKLDLAMAALTIAVGAAACCRLWGVGWRAAVFASMLCCGALLALIGQIYQTGADVWELFAAWAALSLPLALLSRSSAGWALWWLVANTALGLSLTRSPWSLLFFVHSLENTLFLLAGFNLLILALLEWCHQRLLAEPHRYVLRLAALAGILPLMLGASMAWWAMDELGIMVPVFFVCAAVLIWLYYGWRRDLFILAISCYAIVTVLMSMIAHGMGDLVNPFSWVILAVILAVMSGSVAVGLIHLYRRQSARKKAKITRKINNFVLRKKTVNNMVVAQNNEQKNVLQMLLAAGIINKQQVRAGNTQSGTPWWLNLILSLVACIVAGIVLMSVGMATHFEGISTGVLGMLCLVGALIWSRSEEAIFMQQLGLSFSLSGQALFFWTLTKHNYGIAFPYVFSAMLAALLTLPRTTTLHRTVCALVVWISLGYAVTLSSSLNISVLVQTLVILSASTVAMVLWIQRADWTQWLNGRQSGLFKAWAQAGALANIVWVLSSMKYMFYSYQIKQEYSIRLISWPYIIGAILLFMGLCVWLTRSAAPKQRWLLLGSAAIFTAIGWYYPRLLIVTALTLAVFQACQRVWSGILLALLVIIVGNCYYNASVTLLSKSISMMVLGAALLMLRWLLVRQIPRGQA